MLAVICLLRIGCLIVVDLLTGLLLVVGLVLCGWVAVDLVRVWCVVVGFVILFGC